MEHKFIYLPVRDKKDIHAAAKDISKRSLYTVVVVCLNRFRHLSFRKSLTAIKKYITKSFSKRKRESFLSRTDVQILLVGDICDRVSFEESYVKPMAPWVPPAGFNRGLISD